MKKCLYCNKKFSGGFWNNLFRDFCNNECEVRHEKELIEEEKEYRKNENLKLFNRLKDAYVYKEEVKNEIKEKYFELENYEDGKEVLLDLINAWKEIQDKRLKIINIETWQWTGRFIEQCEPHEAKIIYTFDV